MNESHNLSEEFSEFKDTIHDLKISNVHFRKLFERFQDLDRAIMRSEKRIDLISDIEEETLRKERLKVKDEVYMMIKSVKPS